MTDNLIQRLRDEIEFPGPIDALLAEAADALEAKDKEIERLKEENRTYLEMLARAGLFPAHD